MCVLSFCFCLLWKRKGGKCQKISLSTYLYLQGLFLLLSKVIFFVEYSIFNESDLGASLFFHWSLTILRYEGEDCPEIIYKYDFQPSLKYLKSKKMQKRHRNKSFILACHINFALISPTICLLELIFVG